MLKRPLIVILLLLLGSCGTKKKPITRSTNRPTVIVRSSGGSPSVTTPPPAMEAIKNSTVDAVIASAMTFSGVKYQFGGATRKGMDCSGLVFVALKENAIQFPRVSYQMANEGRRVKLRQVRKGDLVFFRTKKSSKRINHVGLVVDVKGGEVRFIHATSSRGVIVSSLREGFWNHAFVKATRIL